jgi:hypothetical protein
MRLRTATFAAAATLGLLAAGCGDDKCNDQTPPISTTGVPDCTAAAGTTVSVPIRVCPKCDQGTPRCEVHMDVANSAIQLEPLSEVCEASSSCPIVDPSTCPASPVTCTFTAPPAAGSPYDLVVITPDGQQLSGTLTIGAGSGCI